MAFRKDDDGDQVIEDSGGRKIFLTTVEEFDQLSNYVNGKEFATVARGVATKQMAEVESEIARVRGNLDHDRAELRKLMATKGMIQRVLNPDS